jgi:hypothetical protein
VIGEGKSEAMLEKRVEGKPCLLAFENNNRMIFTKKALAVKAWSSMIKNDHTLLRNYTGKMRPQNKTQKCEVVTPPSAIAALP